MKKHFVTFLSPGTFFSEETTIPIKTWDIKKASKMAHEVVERYNATPFAFQFSTRERSPKMLDSRVTKRSGRFYLGGEILTLEQVKAQNDPNNRILISNMEANGWDRVIINKNSWRVAQPFEKDDVLLDWTPKAHPVKPV